MAVFTSEDEVRRIYQAGEKLFFLAVAQAGCPDPRTPEGEAWVAQHPLYSKLWAELHCLPSEVTDHSDDDSDETE